MAGFPLAPQRPGSDKRCHATLQLSAEQNNMRQQEFFDKALLFTVGVYEKRSCVSIEFLPHFYHKIWGAVSVMMEGVYRVGQSSG